MDWGVLQPGGGDPRVPAVNKSRLRKQNQAGSQSTLCGIDDRVRIGGILEKNRPGGN